MSDLKTASADEYEQKLASRTKLSAAEKRAGIQTLLKQPDGFQRLGQGMVGPIRLRLRYEGMSRNVLQEDQLERGPVMPYDVLDELGMAYVMNTTDGAVKVQTFEGKQVTPDLQRIAAYPRIRKEDLVLLRVNAVEYAQDESRQAIAKQEDWRLVKLLEEAIVRHGANGRQPVGGTMAGLAAGPAGHTTEKTVLIGAGNGLEPVDLYKAAAMVDVEANESTKVLIHSVDARDLYLWDTATVGWDYKDRVVGGEKVQKFGEFELQRSLMVPQGETFLVSEPKGLGVMPIMYSLDVEENHQVDEFYRGWVMDEMIGQAILNARGIARIVKATSYSDIGSTVGSAVHRLQDRGIAGG